MPRVTLKLPKKSSRVVLKIQPKIEVVEKPKRPKTVLHYNEYTMQSYAEALRVGLHGNEPWKDFYTRKAEEAEEIEPKLIHKPIPIENIELGLHVEYLDPINKSGSYELASKSSLAYHKHIAEFWNPSTQTIQLAVARSKLEDQHDFLTWLKIHNPNMFLIWNHNRPEDMA